MNNFFLFNESLNTDSVVELENGIKDLTEVLVLKQPNRDIFMRDEHFWDYETCHGFAYEFTYSIIDKELYPLTIKLFDSYTKSPIYISNEKDFDILFDNDCNGFQGINFSKTGIQQGRQIVDPTTFNQFVLNCKVKKAYDSVKDFWDTREVLFPNLIFCNEVKEQISSFSITDDRFKLIDDKLKLLNNFTGKWTEGAFNLKNLGLDSSPDTPTRINSTLKFRTFLCPGLGNRVFSYHSKWYVGNEPFRLYFFPESSNRKVYVGYIGGKEGIGF